MAFPQEQFQFVGVVFEVLLIGEPNPEDRHVFSFILELGHHGGDRYHEAIIEIGTGRCHSARREHPYNLNGQSPDEHILADRVFLPKQLIHQVLPDQGHVAQPSDVVHGEIGTLHHGPGPGLAVIFGGPNHDGLSLFVLVADRDVHIAGQGNNHISAGKGFPRRLDVSEGEGLLPLPDRSRFVTARYHQQRIRPKDGNDIIGLLEGSFGCRHDDRYRRNPQGDAGEAEDGAQLESNHCPQ